VHVLKRHFRERNQIRVGVVGLASVALLIALALNVGAIRTSLLGSQRQAAFADSSGLVKGDAVRIAGLNVGSVEGVKIVGAHVEVAFSLEGPRLGSATRATIKSDNALGKKYLALAPSGSGDEKSIPLSRTSSSYSVTDALADLSTTTGEIDMAQLTTSLDDMSAVLEKTPQSLRSAVGGVGRISQVVAGRDQALQQLFADADGFTKILSDRSGQITQLMSDGAAFFDELQARRQAIHRLLVDTGAATRQIQGVIDDNKETIGPTLSKLQGVIAILDKNKDNLQYALNHLGGFIRSLGEAVGGGPFFYAYLQNLVPADLAPVIPQLVEESK